jgi:drug/metabolite transporter (DMT)-like permease
MNNRYALLQNTWLIWIYFAFLSIVWGSSFILMKRGLEVFSAWQVASLRLISALCVLVFFALRSFKNIPISKLPFVLASGLFSSLLPSFLFCAAQQGMNSSTAGILNALTPSFTFLIGYLFFQQKMSWKIIIALLIGLLGTAVLILVNPKGEITLNSYSFFVILATLSYGINLNLVKRHIGNIKPLDFTTVAITFSGILALLYMLTTDLHTFWHSVQYHPKVFVAVLILGIFGTAIAQIVLNRLINLAGSIFASANTYVIPIVAILWGVYDGETLLIWHFLGMALILLSIAILNKKNKNL